MQSSKLKCKTQKSLDLILNLFPSLSSPQYSAQLRQAFSTLKSPSGQALITLLFFSLIGILITTAAVMIAITNRLSIQRVEYGMTARSIAESGMENALLQLLRNPFYTGETLPVGSGSATITVTGTTTKTITSTGSIGNYQRTIAVQVSYTNSVMSIVSWTEQ